MNRASALFDRDKLPTARVHSLLLLCSRARLDDEATAEIRTLAANGMDWADGLPLRPSMPSHHLCAVASRAWPATSFPELWRNRSREVFSSQSAQESFSDLGIISCVNSAWRKRRACHTVQGAGARGAGLWRHRAPSVRRPRPHLAASRDRRGASGVDGPRLPFRP